jgi:hypothetical protein
MATISNFPLRDPAPRNRIPPLQPGDRLTWPEFKRRFDATPGLKKAELLEGTVYMSPPVSHSFHSRPHSHLIGWLVQYVAMTPGVDAGDNGTLRLDLDNALQPDAFLSILASHGGQARLDEDGYLIGAPELVAEVAASTVSYDLHGKLNVYRRHGVKEYVVWRVNDGAVDWFILREGQYERLALSDGRFRSETFPGLWLEPAALVRGDLRTVLNVVIEGTADPAHAKFLSALESAATKPNS